MHAAAYGINERTVFHLRFIKAAAGCEQTDIYHSVCEVDECRARLYKGGIWLVNKHTDNAGHVVLKKTNSESFCSKYENYSNAFLSESSNFRTESSVTA